MSSSNGDLFARRLNTPTALGQYAHISDGTFTYPKLEGDVGARMRFKGQEVICWSINNYLGLSNHPEVREVDAVSARRYGMGYPMGARLLTGDTEQHDLLESELADYVQKEACFLLNFGYQGVMSVVDAMLDRHDAVVYDKEVHACTYDGIRMQQCGRYAFRHNDVADLERQLEKAYAKTSLSGGGILVIVEGVYGMRGHQGKLREVVALKKRYNFRLLVDDAHGFGVLGETGAGTGEAQGVQDDIDLYFSTFTKSMSTLGAFIAGNADIIRYLRYTTRSQIFSKTLPMPIIVGARKRLELIRTRPELRETLWKRVHSLQAGLYDAGFDIGVSGSVITPVFLQCELGECHELITDLRVGYGVFTSAIIYPIVPKGTLLLRLIPTAVHTEEDIDQTLAAFKTVHTKLKAGTYRDTAPAELIGAFA